MMTNRRQFLYTAAALSAAPFANRIAFANGQWSAMADVVIVDTRHRRCRAFCVRASQLGATPRAIDGDVTDLWQHELRSRLGNAPAVLAGLTERPAMFLLERLAWDFGLRVVFEAEHVAAAGSGDRHRVLRSADRALGSRLAQAADNWPAVLADELVAARNVMTRDFRPTDSGLVSVSGAPVRLHSWIIAPRINDAADLNGVLGADGHDTLAAGRYGLRSRQLRRRS